MLTDPVLTIYEKLKCWHYFQLYICLNIFKLALPILFILKFVLAIVFFYLSITIFGGEVV